MSRSTSRTGGLTGAGALLAASCCAAGRPAVLVAVLAAGVVHLVIRRPGGAPALLAAATVATGYTALAVVGDAQRTTIDTRSGSA